VVESSEDNPLKVVSPQEASVRFTTLSVCSPLSNL